MAEESNKITLIDEDNVEHQFILLNVVEMDGAKYAVMVPEEEMTEEEEQEAVIFRIETDENGEEVLVDIEDDEEFAKVCDLLDELMAEDEDEENPQ
ncbi:MAG TPA: DUF1292 domain-containing protein [Bacillota bacterium]|nr:DUF1292 domain-containing protein [Bacillota bacterium]HPT87120.1 DUF1292 domain-containing protein [Bacillota bacterium]